jgi:hypothetical protein
LVFLLWKLDVGSSFLTIAALLEIPGSKMFIPIPSKLPFSKKHSQGILLKPHKNDNKTSARRSGKKKNSVAPSPIGKQVEFASFDSFIIDEPEEEAARAQQSR